MNGRLRPAGAARIREAVAADVPQLTAIHNHYVENTAATFDIEPWTAQRRREEWFARYSTAGPHRLLVADDAGRILGMAWSGPWRPRAAYHTTVETSVYCLAEQTGRGLGSALYGKLFEILEAEPLHRAFALIVLPNDASERLHSRFGFSRVGVLSEAGRKFGRYWDIAVWERPLDGRGD